MLVVPCDKAQRAPIFLKILTTRKHEMPMSRQMALLLTKTIESDVCQQQKTCRLSESGMTLRPNRALCYEADDTGVEVKEQERISITTQKKDWIGSHFGHCRK